MLLGLLLVAGVGLVAVSSRPWVGQTVQGIAVLLKR
jgi:hypothetical protein